MRLFILIAFLFASPALALGNFGTTNLPKQNVGVPMEASCLTWPIPFPVPTRPHPSWPEAVLYLGGVREVLGEVEPGTFFVVLRADAPYVRLRCEGAPISAKAAPPTNGYSFSGPSRDFTLP